MYNVYKSDELFLCPHCGVEQEYQIEDYLIHGDGIKSYSNEECHSCYGTMHFVSMTKGLVRISKIRSGLLMEEKKDEANYNV